MGHSCADSLLPSVYRAALDHSPPFGSGGGRASHAPWEAVTFVAVSTVSSISVAFLFFLLFVIALNANNQTNGVQRHLLGVAALITTTPLLLVVRIDWDGKKTTFFFTITSRE